MDLFLKFVEFIDLGQCDLIQEIYSNNYQASIEVTEEIIQLFLNKIKIKNSAKGFGGYNLKYLKFL